MRAARWIALVFASVATATLAHAGGVNFTWSSLGECYTDDPHTIEAFTCDTNAGHHTMVASFALDAPVPDFVGAEVVLDLLSESDQLPDWWQYYNPGSCRRLSLSASSDFTDLTTGTCQDPWGGQAVGGIAAYQTATTIPPVTGGPRNARIKVAYALAAPVALEAGVEYLGAKVTLDNAATTGAGACGECSTAVLVLLDDVAIAHAGGPIDHASTVIANYLIYWQHYVSIPDPVVNVSWGRIKSLYR